MNPEGQRTGFDSGDMLLFKRKPKATTPQSGVAGFLPLLKTALAVRQEGS